MTTWNDILDLLIKRYGDEPNHSQISVGHWITHTSPRYADIFSAYLKITTRELLEYNRPCEWRLDDDLDVMQMFTSCGRAFVFAGEIEEDILFCPYCGRRIQTKRPDIVAKSSSGWLCKCGYTSSVDIGACRWCGKPRYESLDAPDLETEKQSEMPLDTKGNQND